jgi:hypothetical protein
VNIRVKLVAVGGGIARLKTKYRMWHSVFLEPESTDGDVETIKDLSKYVVGCASGNPDNAEKILSTQRKAAEIEPIATASHFTKFYTT